MILVLAVTALLLVPLIIATSWYAGLLLRSYAVAMYGGFGFGKAPKAAPVPLPPNKGTEDREPAHLYYLFGQAWRDVRHAHLESLKGLGKTISDRWKKIQAKHWQDPAAAGDKDRSGSPWTGVWKLVAFGAGLALTASCLLLFAIGEVLALGLMFLTSLGLLYLLRGLDTAVLWLRGVTMTCRNCGRRTTFAEYTCAAQGCEIRHKNLRPGRYGMIRRRCFCGKPFATMMSLGSYQLKSWCPHCGKPLAEQTGMSPEIVLPVFGAPSAGKTQLITVLIMAIETMVARTGGKFRYADESVRASAMKARRELLTTNQTKKTQRGRDTVVDPAYSMYVTPKKKSRTKLLHVFDAAGEIFADAKHIQELEYLKISRTFVFVIDPLSIGELWLAIDVGQRESLKDRRAQQEPRKTFTETVQTVVDMGIDTSKVNLVVAVSKMDLIADLLRGLDTRDDQSIREWLEETLRQGNMIRAMDHHFKNVSFFFTSALADQHERADNSVEMFIEKTLAAESLKL